ncbi:WhiB family transcriptional regulator [Streptomyces sp. NBC_01500]|uniref:WhiB family transcriptional regulator n=1 Tax=Streptomyces sp. NBC_01500 TaxID=2903886 RepID=UPI002254EDA7|nr:WhiB family transcriptional regulator [Streptomyces sp. NBC_01500]MCX4554272.1 WhiB family transcriptional regulator [Streptomyces sp. NBC_01500]
MTSTQARHTRRTVLQAAVTDGARCTAMDPDQWFRADDEPTADWHTRRAAAIRICTGCPLRAACEELALRNGDGEPDADEMVRAGLTGQELAAIREHQAPRLAAAIAADQDTEGRQLTDLVMDLQAEVARNPDSSRNGGPRSAAARQATQNTRVRTLTTQIRNLRTARRARTGWVAGGTTTMSLTPRAGIVDDIEREDDRKGYEPEDAFHQLVARLVADDDACARTAGRQARRTLAQMAPGYTRQPVLRMTSARIVFDTVRTCSSCFGQGGRMVETGSDGVTCQRWVTCQPCRGTGLMVG